MAKGIVLEKISIEAKLYVYNLLRMVAFTTTPNKVYSRSNVYSIEIMAEHYLSVLQQMNM